MKTDSSMDQIMEAADALLRNAMKSLAAGRVRELYANGPPAPEDVEKSMADLAMIVVERGTRSTQMIVEQIVRASDARHKRFVDALNNLHSAIKAAQAVGIDSKQLSAALEAAEKIAKSGPGEPGDEDDPGNEDGATLDKSMPLGQPFTPNSQYTTTGKKKSDA